MKNEKICKMLDILEKRANKIRSDLLTELKSEKNFELAVKIFEISDELCFKENRKYHEIARQQARRTTAECLNIIFKDENIDFRKGSITLFQKLEMYVVKKDHIQFLSEYIENETAILFRENIDLALDIRDDIIWLAEIDMGKIEYTLLSDHYDNLFSINIDCKPDENTREKGKKWYKDHGFVFKIN